MTRLSINVNKIALIRNSRGSNFPDLTGFIENLLALGVVGITAHPRPDQRHVKDDDIYIISKIIERYPNVELNVEGFPDQRFINLIKDVNPAQCTLVPDSPTQLTSDHGWDLRDSFILESAILDLRSSSTRIALLIESNKEDVLLAKEFNVDAVEIYTENYASKAKENEANLALQAIANACNVAKREGMIVNAGHDLNLNNLDQLLRTCSIQEVSIGHAFTVECIYHGLNNVVSKYLEICRKY